MLANGKCTREAQVKCDKRLEDIQGHIQLGNLERFHDGGGKGHELCVL